VGHRVRVVAASLFAVAVCACSGGAAKPSLEEVVPTTSMATPNGTVVIGETTYSFAMTCYAPGVGSVVAVGSGVEPVTNRRTRALVQAFFRDSYIAVTIGDNEVVFEPSLEEPVELTFVDDVVQGPAIRFVRGLDLRDGVAQPAGMGSVTVHCDSYRPGLPPGYGG
jgi:hypothetical protein